MELGQGSTGAPAAGWYADPAGSGLLRYWDGRAWTEHLAPAAPQTPYAATQATAPAYQRRRKAPHERAWTKGTVATLIVCAVLVVATVPALAWMAGAKAEALRGDPGAALEQFLAATTVGDPAWRDAADPALHPETDDTATPLYGDLASAQQLDLAIDYRYDLAELDYANATESYIGGEPETADSASVPVDFTYTYTVDGETFTSELTQAVWLTRPFYYDGSDEPSASQASRTPSAVGPWRVAGFAAGSTISYDSSGEEFATTFTDAAVESDETVCFDVEAMILEMSRLSRQDGMLRSSCLFRQGDASLRPEALDPAAVAQQFPVMNEFSEIPNDIMGARAGFSSLPPLSQYPITVGDSEYVFTVAATPPDESSIPGQTLRFIQVAEVAGA
ncbi:DUF2510 domain-containing protein [Leucobacter chromiiresistens]|uniref:DUF2510 domain-containing protein n=1 Tax=Leucobacter chromiiresistens TaxID=1079994 RepID=A0A1H0XTJ3_9MICO|nr:DUF2510 domain-containing protein [Leucobacter chromiiresistens]SDQ06234.1 Protein of unknown function [Leucobacter chromiiresistens]